MAEGIRKRHKPGCVKFDDKRKRCNCDGPWQARIPDPDRPGTTHKIERQFRTQAEAEAWRNEQLHSHRTGTWFDPRKADRVFGAVLTAWRESWSDRLSPTTALRYESVINTYLNDEFSNVPIARITHEAVQRYINSLKSKHAPGTTRNIYAVLRTAMAYGVRLGMVRVNPCLGIDLPRQRHEEPVFLTADEVRAVAEAIGPQYRVLVYTAAWTGMRAGELGGLQRRDVNLLKGTVAVRRSLKDVNGHLRLGEVKTAQSRRTISLPSFLREMLTEHLNATPGAPEDYVFTMKGGQPLRHNTVYRYFKRAVCGCEVRGKKVPGALPAAKHNVRWHDLRHTCASLSIAAGAHPKLISARLGHSTITITLDRYGHLFPSVEEALADALDAAFRAEPVESNVVTLAR